MWKVDSILRSILSGIKFLFKHFFKRIRNKKFFFCVKEKSFGYFIYEYE
jgi:hypothetical protein